MPLQYTPRASQAPPEPSGAPSAGTALASLAALIGGGLLLRRPGVLRKIPQVANTIRYTGMLSGLAAPKSIMGNIGAGVVASAESGSLRPLRELLRPQTVKRAYTLARQGATLGPTPGGVEATAGGTVSGLNPFGRVMGGADLATREALVRAGVAPREAERLVLQTPIPQAYAKALDNPVARFLMPFRRTPLNQLMEGMKAYAPVGRVLAREMLDPLTKRKLYTLGAAKAAGAATGLATEDMETNRAALPMVMGTALAGVYGLPFAVSAAGARYYFGRGTKASAERPLQGVVSPVSEYGILSTVTDPLRPLREPAGLRYLRRPR